MSDDSVRCFLGVPLGAESNRALDATVAQLREADSTHHAITWTGATNRHMTLAFLGQQPLSLMYKLEAALQQRLLDCVGFSVAAETVAGFPDAKSPVVAVQLETCSHLLALVTTIQATLSAFELPVERRSYRPHVTLGRLKRGRSWRQAPIPLQWRLEVSSVVLFRSHLLPEGVQYSAVWSLPLLTVDQ